MNVYGTKFKAKCRKSLPQHYWKLNVNETKLLYQLISAGKVLPIYILLLVSSSIAQSVNMVQQEVVMKATSGSQQVKVQS